MGSKIYKVLFMLIGIGTLAYMIQAMGIDEIWNNLEKIGWWFLPVLGSWAVLYWMNAMAFKAIIQEPELPQTDVPFWKVLQLTISGYAINYITPFVALGGEPYRIMELKNYVGSSKAGSSVLLYGVMHILSHILFWVASVFLILWFVPASTMVDVACAVIFVMAIICTWLFTKFYKKGITVSLLKALSKLPLVGKKVGHLLETKFETLNDVDQQVKNLFQNRRDRFYKALFWEFVARVVGCFEIYFIGLALDINIDFIDAMIISSGSSLFANLVFFFPMQLGTREGGLAMAVMSIGLPAKVGIFMGVVTRIREIVWIMIGLGWMSLVKKK
ncbi:lysylphosphatidylglycerol synthase transmembrane domain-containing protein [Sphingobacterium sp. Lzh-3]|uniref:lysylphosphatidylglycerol synthase transmembrane domain-containing protein n=1 Tax=unclassified Sphingobacterium TaxID=2609468 RepID=UPI00295469B1|nr:lysylphosphatidylglycerol synthase transmembrane domain-containing protein [Sphingobacterium sp. UGAL515B_05]WON94507.1 flippase-like domain-containing protein [Sphingobacterium sp. UGAL515B_05]